MLVGRLGWTVMELISSCRDVVTIQELLSPPLAERQKPSVVPANTRPPIEGCCRMARVRRDCEGIPCTLCQFSPASRLSYMPLQADAMIWFALRGSIFIAKMSESSIMPFLIIRHEWPPSVDL